VLLVGRLSGDIGLILFLRVSTHWVIELGHLLHSIFSMFKSTAAPTHQYFRPCGMMQVFSLRLSSTQSRPVNMYGYFAVRDLWEPF
jgi:hypothetical protein